MTGQYVALRYIGYLQMLGWNNLLPIGQSGPCLSRESEGKRFSRLYPHPEVIARHHGPGATSIIYRATTLPGVGNLHARYNPRSPLQCSQRSGGPGGPTGKLPRRLGRTRRQFLLRPVLGHFRTAGLSKDHGPHKVRHYYAILIKGPQETVVDCRSPDKGGGDL